MRRKLSFIWLSHPASVHGVIPGSVLRVTPGIVYRGPYKVSSGINLGLQLMWLHAR